MICLVVLNSGLGRSVGITAATKLVSRLKDLTFPLPAIIVQAKGQIFKKL